MNQTVVEVVYSRSNKVRGIIAFDRNGIYRVQTEFWETRYWHTERIAYWSQRHLGTLADTLENARALCREHMAATAAP